MTFETYERVTAAMADHWPKEALKPETLLVRWTALRDLDDSVFEAAVADCMTSCTFYPTPAEIRARARGLLPAAGLLPATGEQAWAQLLEAMRDWSPDNGWRQWNKYGTSANYGVPSPLPELTEQAVRAIGGLKRIDQTDLQDLGFVRKEFVSFYDHKRESELTYTPGLLSQPLPGLLEGAR